MAWRRDESRTVGINLMQVIGTNIKRSQRCQFPQYIGLCCSLKVLPSQCRLLIRFATLCARRGVATGVVIEGGKEP